MTEYRALTLHQPWASLVAEGAKTVETRSWATKYRGPLLIHAAARLARRGVYGEWSVDGWRPEGWLESCMWRSVDTDSPTFPRSHKTVALPLGTVVAVAELVDVVPTDTLSGFLTIGGTESSDDPDCWIDEHEPPCHYGGRRWSIIANEPYGDFTPGRYAWLLANVRKLDDPIPAKGRQRLWTPDSVLEAQVERLTA